MSRIVSYCGGCGMEYDMADGCPRCYKKEDETISNLHEKEKDLIIAQLKGKLQKAEKELEELQPLKNAFLNSDFCVAKHGKETILFMCGHEISRNVGYIKYEHLAGNEPVINIRSVKHCDYLKLVDSRDIDEGDWE